MLTLRKNDSKCPNCGRCTDIQNRGENSPEKVCMGCGHVWHPTTDGMQNVRVRVIEPNSVWKGEIGSIKEILPITGRNIRVAFKPSKTDTFADLFHTSHLEQL